MSKNTEFVFVTPAFNCQDTIAQTIKSAYAQSYDDWRMVVYDDVSTDHTAQVVEDTSKLLNLGSKLTVVRRDQKYGEVRNTLDATEGIADDEVVCRLDAGDWLTEIDALKILDDAYRQTSAAVMWTKHRWAYTSHNISKQLDPAEPDVYKHPWVTSHLKTFRRDALSGINPHNFLDEEGNYIMIACDQAVFLPILHKAHLDKRLRVFVPLVMYHYSIDLKDPELFSNDRSLRQKHSAEWIRERGYIE